MSKIQVVDPFSNGSGLDQVLPINASALAAETPGWPYGYQVCLK
jgi:hypothetical protein